MGMVNFERHTFDGKPISTSEEGFKEMDNTLSVKEADGKVADETPNLEKKA